MQPAPLAGRPPERSSEIARDLRSRITSGTLGPGAKLPTRAELERQFGVSPGTVQRALEELRGDGFITVRGCKGTFVSTAPPHLTHFALVFASPRGWWSRYFETISQEAPRVAAARGLVIKAYYSVDGRQESEDYFRLLGDVRSRRLGGIIFTSSPHLLQGTELLRQAEVPQVAIMTPNPSSTMPSLYANMSTFWAGASSILKRAGRQKVALLLPALPGSECESILHLLQKGGVQVPTKWMQRVAVARPEPARNLVELLFDVPGCRPECLVIGDDNLAAPALQGLADAGVIPGKDVQVITHWNFTESQNLSEDVTYLGFQISELIGSALDLLAELADGRVVPPSTALSARVINSGAPS